MSIEIKKLTKQYTGKITALNNVSLTIDNGMFGLLGRNGSGKTTLMRLLTTLLEPTEGSISILGMEVNKANTEKIKRSIGYLPQAFGFSNDFTVAEALEYMCLLRGVPKAKQKALIADVLEKVNLTEQAHKQYGKLSGGMKRRVGLAQALLEKPPILIVDEPTAGVDPEERIHMRKLLANYAEKHTVIFSTHIIEDIEYTCNKLAVLDEGNLLFAGELTELLNIANGKIYECVFDTLEDFQAFERKHTVISFKRSGTQTKAIVISENKAFEHGKLYRPSLEEAYVYITTKARAKQWVV